MKRREKESKMEDLELVKTEGYKVGFQDGYQEGLSTGIQEGMKEGITEVKREMVRNLLLLNVDTSIIISATGLSTKEITEIAKVL